jgi:negative regulator of sigma E activity
MNESISALLDGEGTPQELDRLLVEMERNPALREEFSRQCLAREARMGIRVRKPDPGFADRVSAALQKEPSVVVPFGRVRRLPWKGAMSLAAAAGVGAVAMLVASPQVSDGPALGPVPSMASVAPALAGGFVPVAIDPAETQFAQLEDESARQLRNYVMAYSQSRGQQSVRGMLGYARYAAYTTEADNAGPDAGATEASKR